MHPAPGNESGTLVNALMYYTKNKLSNFLNFIISLAEQSFLNEYIIFQSKEELSIVKK